MKVREKLAERLNKEFNLDVNADDFIRTYAGKNLKSQGAFLWMFVNPKKSFTVGGCWPASMYVVKRNKLDFRQSDFNEFEVYVYEPDDVGYDKL